MDEFNFDVYLNAAVIVGGHEISIITVTISTYSLEDAETMIQAVMGDISHYELKQNF